MNHKEINLLLIFLLPVLFGGCFTEEPVKSPRPSQEEIIRTNKVRSQLGIRQIKNSWSYSGGWDNENDWKDGRGRCKKVAYDENYENIVWEEDYYRTGRIFESKDTFYYDKETGNMKGETVHEIMIITYFYETNRFRISVTTDDEEVLSEIGPLECFWDTTPEKADEILQKWGFDRL